MVKIFCNGVLFPKIKAIFFDKDGTLEDSRLYLQQLGRERVNQIALTHPNIKDSLLLAFGISDREIDPAGLMAVGSRQENEIAAAAYITSNHCNWCLAKEIVSNAFKIAGEKIQPNKKNSPMFADSLEVLKTLANTQLKLGIISADSTAGIQSFIDRENIFSYFDLALGSDRALSKPDPLLYLKACKILNVLPKNTLMVGDSLADIQMAQNANARGTIGIYWHSTTSNHLNSATVNISNLKQIQVIEN